MTVFKPEAPILDPEYSRHIAVLWCEIKDNLSNPRWGRVRHEASAFRSLAKAMEVGLNQTVDWDTLSDDEKDKLTELDGILDDEIRLIATNILGEFGVTMEQDTVVERKVRVGLKVAYLLGCAYPEIPEAIER